MLKFLTRQPHAAQRSPIPPRARPRSAHRSDGRRRGSSHRDGGARVGRGLHLGQARGPDWSGDLRQRWGRQVQRLRHPADPATWRVGRGGSRTGRHPALGLGQGQSVLPAWLQPRPRHRLFGFARRRAAQPAHPRPWPGLSRHQRHRPGAGRDDFIPEGPLLCRGGGLLRRRDGRLPHFPDLAEQFHRGGRR